VKQRRIKAAFIRGGTSKGLFFDARDLPEDQAARDAIFLRAIGSPDPNGRQLNGLGGGISSLSKIVTVAPSSEPGIDVDYTFGQVAVDAPIVEYASNCGNLTSAVGPFAVDERMVDVADGDVSLRLRNRNSNRIIVSHFRVADGEAVTAGEYHLPGVTGAGYPIKLDFLDPGGAVTDRLLPCEEPVTGLQVENVGQLDASLIDATTACVFVSATALGLTGAEMPTELDGRQDLLEQLETIRQQAAMSMGLSPSGLAVPKVGIVAAAQGAKTLDGSTLDPSDMDITVRMISMGRPHRALPLTAAMCVAVAARLQGSIPHDLVPVESRTENTVKIAHPSGIVSIEAAVSDGVAKRVSVFRTQRRLMEGRVLI
jgi:2-methylaconitate cis-trans-isomerase PrpF